MVVKQTHFGSIFFIQILWCRWTDRRSRRSRREEKEDLIPCMWSTALPIKSTLVLLTCGEEEEQRNETRKFERKAFFSRLVSSRYINFSRHFFSSFFLSFLSKKNSVLCHMRKKSELETFFFSFSNRQVSTWQRK